MGMIDEPELKYCVPGEDVGKEGEYDLAGIGKTPLDLPLTALKNLPEYLDSSILLKL